MTQKELEKHLKSIANLDSVLLKVFYTKLFKKDAKVYERRSFNDLFIFYRKYGVTEKMLMRALVNLNFVARYCYEPKKVVFFPHEYIPHYKFWLSKEFSKIRNVNHNCGKYTPEYLEKLYDSIFNKSKI